MSLTAHLLPQRFRFVESPRNACHSASARIIHGRIGPSERDFGFGLLTRRPIGQPLAIFYDPDAGRLRERIQRLFGRGRRYDRQWSDAKPIPFERGYIIRASYRPLDRRYLCNRRSYGDFLRPELQPPVRNYLPDPKKVRRRLLALLEQVRAAEKMPWPERDARMWQIVFPQMANWLPPEEAEQLRFEFAQEMERSKRAA